MGASLQNVIHFPPTHSNMTPASFADQEQKGLEIPGKTGLDVVSPCNDPRRPDQNPGKNR
jgi:hypothetical protein